LEGVKTGLAIAAEASAPLTFNMLLRVTEGSAQLLLISLVIIFPPIHVGERPRDRLDFFRRQNDERPHPTFVAIDRSLDVIPSGTSHLGLRQVPMAACTSQIVELGSIELERRESYLVELCPRPLGSMTEHAGSNVHTLPQVAIRLLFRLGPGRQIDAPVTPGALLFIARLSGCKGKHGDVRRGYVGIHTLRGVNVAVALVAVPLIWVSAAVMDGNDVLQFTELVLGRAGDAGEKKAWRQKADSDERSPSRSMQGFSGPHR
jgi:hypothetical protein